MDIDLNSLLVFRHIAETGSFSKTGRYWKISQPSVSIMISRLESAVGLILLERFPTGTRLTPAGIQFLDRAAKVCDAYLSFVDGMRTLSRRMDGKVLVGVDRSWFASRIREAVASNSQPSKISVEICEISETWWEGLEAAQYDVVVAGRFLRAGLSPGIQEAVINQEKGITVAWNPHFYPYDPLKFNFPEILQTTLVIPDGGVVTGFGAFLSMWCEYAYGVQPANVVTFVTETEAAEAAAAGLGVMLAPGDAVPRLGLARDGLATAKTFEFLLPEAFTLGVYCRSGEESKDVLSTAVTIAKLARKSLIEL